MSSIRPRSRERIIRLLLKLLSQPGQFTRRDLAKKFGCSKNTIDDDIKIIEAVGLGFNQNGFTHKCEIIPDRSFKELEYLMPLSKEEQLTVSMAIDQYFAKNKKAVYLKNKINSLYDFQQLGIRALRRPELDKLDRLKHAHDNQLQVILESYRSNSNQIRDRRIEAFHVDAEHGTIQAYDVEDKAVRHFKLNRFKRIHITTEEWEFSQYHDHKYTDVFRIANNKKVNVALNLDVYAFNALMENYPKARGDISDGSAPNTFHFQSDINADFLGLTNFILGNRGHVQILSPENLKTHIINEAQKIIDSIKAET